MRVRRLNWCVAAAAVLLPAAGCGDGPKYVKVSGVVTVDGQPYPNAVVAFQPLGTAENPNPGRGSSGITDANGRFTLATDDGHDGAVVGKHRVRIQTKREDGNTEVVDPSVGSADSPPPPKGKKQQVEPIPTEWYSDTSTKEFDVPAGGTDQANFAITSVKPKK